VIHYQAVALGLLLTVLVLGIFVGRGPVFVAATLSALLWDYLFIPPQYTFNISKFEDIMMFATYFVIAIITGNLAARIRNQERAGSLREERTAALYALAREVSSDVTLDDVLHTVVTQMQRLFNADVAILLRTSADHLSEQVHPTSTFTLDQKERSVAMWAFDNGKTAGRFTDTLPVAQAQYIPLLAPSGVFGVIGVKPKQGEQLSFDQEALLETFVSQIALAIERTMLGDAAERAKVLEESERLYNTLLNSISHELRTPLATITGAASGLLDEHINSDPKARQALGEDLQDATERLNRLVDNLLDMTRLESGQLKLNLEWCDVSDLINVSLNRVEKQLADHDLVVEISPSLPLIRADFVLMEQALVNLLHNAAIYTPAGTRVRVQARVEDGNLLIVVADRGAGLPSDATDQVFDKFYRAPGAAAGGTGLGLSISRGLVEAHGGTLTAENRANGGARFTIRLPITKAPELPKEPAQ
jgi:two-component system sensor histidine kinase KdpD